MSDNSKYLEKVSAGEVCSIDIAKGLGIDDIVLNDKHYKNGYNNLKTFNAKIDAKEDRSMFSLCEVNNIETRAYPVCPLHKGSGSVDDYAFGFTKKFIGSDYSCITSECPSTFTQQKDENGIVVDDTKCMKPRLVKTSPIGKYNDERWYDWFTIPEYQIGNKYNSENNVNYSPCIKGSLPKYSVDPVDGASINMKVAPDEINKCISKQLYFGGKYVNSPSYCPISWIMRTGATKTDYIYMYEDFIEELEKKGNPTGDLDIIKKNIPAIVQSEIYDPIQKEGFKEYISSPNTSESAQACRNLYNDAKRVQKAYDVCTILKEKDPKDAIEYLLEKNSETNRTVANAKYIRARQACHAVFCDPKEGAMINIDGKPICFPDVEKANMESEIAAIEEEERKQAALEAKPINSNAAKETAISMIIKYGIMILKLVFILIIVIVVTIKIILPAWRWFKINVAKTTTNEKILSDKVVSIIEKKLVDSDLNAK